MYHLIMWGYDFTGFRKLVFINNIMRLLNRLSVQQKLGKPLLLLSLLLLSFQISYPQDKKEEINLSFDKKERVNELRNSLAENRLISFNALQGSGPLPLSKDLRQSLALQREQLRQVLIQATAEEFGNDVVRTIADAQSDLQILKINEYERILGVGDGEKTTAFNVLSGDDLKLINQKAEAQLKIIGKEILQYPSQTSSPELLGRQRFLQQWKNKTTAELQRRSVKKEATVNLKQIVQNPSPKQAQQLVEALSQFEGESGRIKFETKLRFYVELNSSFSPSLSLEKVSSALRNRVIPPQQVSFEAKMERGPPSKWKNPQGEVKGMIRELAFNEHHAKLSGDQVNAAKYGSQKAVLQRWLHIARGGENEPISKFFSLGEDDLLSLKEGNKKVLLTLIDDPSPESAILREKIATDIQKINLEINNNKLYNVAELDGFSPPKRGPPGRPNIQTSALMDLNVDEGIAAQNKKEELIRSRLQEFERGMAKRQQRLELIQVKKFKDEPRIIPDTRLEKRYTTLTEKISTSQVNGPKGNQLRPAKLFAQPQEVIGKPNPNSFSEKLAVKYSESRPPSSFETLFPKNELNKSYRQLIKKENIAKAPGGVMIDLKSAQDTTLLQLEEVYFDYLSGQVYGYLEGKWTRFEITDDPDLLIQSWTFAEDERISAVDLREIRENELRWLTRSLREDPKTIMEVLVTLRRDLTAVHLHPSFLNTNTGLKLILIDQIIFDLLPRESIYIKGQLDFQGLDLKGLRDAYFQDNLNLIISSNPNRYRILKSIILVCDVSTSFDTTIGISPIVDLLLFQKDGEVYESMDNTSQWFATHSKQISERIPLLQEFEELCKVIFLCQWTRYHQIPNNLDEILYLETTEAETPDFIFPAESGWGKYHSLLEKL